MITDFSTQADDVFISNIHIHDDDHDNFHHYSDLEESETGNHTKDKQCEKRKCILHKFRYPDGSVKLRNPHIEFMEQDILYHLALGSGSHDLVKMFGDTKFVCMGGTPKRMENFANFIMEEIGYKLPTSTQLIDISRHSYRYCLYKVGPVLSVSHGMGISSISILLHEIIKLMYHAKVKNPIFFRIGTCGGIGLEGGTVVITDEAIDSTMGSYYSVPILGKIVKRPAKLDKRLVNELKCLADLEDSYSTVSGKTMCTSDFYEEQGRLDGAFCEYAESDKMDFLNQLSDQGVVNIEMEAIPFAALTYHAGIKAAIVCVAFLDRLKGDQVNASKEILHKWQERPQKLVARYIKRYLLNKGKMCFEGHGSMSVGNPDCYKLVEQESEAFE